MKRFVLGLALAVLLSSAAFAGDRIETLVIDSGSDFTHPYISGHAVPNLQELNGKANVDDDNNGYKDDVYGWNFIDNSNVIVHLEYAPPDYPKVMKFMALMGKLQAYGKEALTKDEYNFLYTNYQDPKFRKWINFVGGWAHGTHVAGIIAGNNPAAGLNAITHIQSGTPPTKGIKEALDSINYQLLQSQSGERRATEPADNANAPKKKLSLEYLGKMFANYGKQYAEKVKDEAKYIATFKPRLINCSWGVPNQNLLPMMKKNMVEQWGWTNPTDKEVQEVVNLFVKNAFLPRDVAFFKGVPQALIFIAAGNSHENNDELIGSPNSVPISNKIVIAATMENKKLADFSCYGKKTVDVAVPGVNILSSYPAGQMGYMSGTSMACPMAVRFGSMVLKKNEALTPQQLKKILMETVDKKAWLADKVVSGGVINVNRAMYAAKLMKDGKSIDAAIKDARAKVKDMVDRTPSKFKGPDLTDKKVKELYFSAVF